MTRLLTIGLLVLAVAGCGAAPLPTDPIELCNYWGGDKRPVVDGELMGLWEYRDPTNGCRYVSGEVHGTYTHDGMSCLGPPKCRTITRAEWKAEGKP